MNHWPEAITGAITGMIAGYFVTGWMHKRARRIADKYVESARLRREPDAERIAYYAAFAAEERRQAEGKQGKIERA